MLQYSRELCCPGARVGAFPLKLLFTRCLLRRYSAEFHGALGGVGGFSLSLFSSSLRFAQQLLRA